VNQGVSAGTVTAGVMAVGPRARALGRGIHLSGDRAELKAAISRLRKGLAGAGLDERALSLLKLW
jgi:hypothetical protein